MLRSPIETRTSRSWILLLREGSARLGAAPKGPQDESLMDTTPTRETRAAILALDDEDPAARVATQMSRHTTPSVYPISHPAQKRLDPRKGFGRVDAGHGLRGGLRDMHAVAVPERPQLFERLRPLERRRRPPHVFLEESRTIGIHAEMAPVSADLGYAATVAAEGVAVPRDRRTAEIEGITRPVHHDLHDIRIEQLRPGGEARAQRGDARGLVRGEVAGHLPYQPRRHQGLVPLQIDDDVVRRIRAARRDLGQAIGARAVGSRRHAHVRADV